MASVSEDEANYFASDFVKRLQLNAIQQAEGRSSPTVTGDDSKRRNTTRTYFPGDDSAKGSGNRKNGDFEQSASSTALAGNTHNSQEKQAKIVQNLKNTQVGVQNGAYVHHRNQISGGNGLELRPNASDIATVSSPRVDLEALRRKRLKFFKTVDVNQHITSRSNPMGCKSDTSANESNDLSGFTIRKSTELSSEHDMFENTHTVCENTPPQAHDRLQRSENGHRGNTNETSYCFDKEDDDIRLEFWGLTEAVQTGKINLDKYLQKRAPTAADTAQDPSAKPSVNPNKSGACVSGSVYKNKHGKTSPRGAKTTKQGSVGVSRGASGKKSPRNGRYSPRTFLSSETCSIPVGGAGSDYSLATALNKSQDLEHVEHATRHESKQQNVDFSLSSENLRSSFENTQKSPWKSSAENKIQHRDRMNGMVDGVKGGERSRKHVYKTDLDSPGVSKNILNSPSTRKLPSTKSAKDTNEWQSSSPASLCEVGKSSEDACFVKRDQNWNGVVIKNGNVRKASPPRIETPTVSDLELFSQPQIEGALYHKFDKSISPVKRPRQKKVSKSMTLTAENLRNERECFWSNDLLSSESSPAVSEKGLPRRSGASSPEKILAELTDFISSGRSASRQSLGVSRESKELDSPLGRPYSNGQKIFSSIIGERVAEPEVAAVQRKAHRSKTSEMKSVDEYIGSELLRDVECDSYKDPAMSYKASASTDMNGCPDVKGGSSASNVTAKICPACEEVNSKAANWCVECGLALISIKPVQLTRQQTQTYQKQCQTTKALILETFDSEKDKLESMGFGDKVEQLQKDVRKLKLTKEMQNDEDETSENNVPGSQGYKRRWEKSSIAWSSYNPRELSTASSLPPEKPKASAAKNSKVKNKNRKKSGRKNTTNSGRSLSQSWDYCAELDRLCTEEEVNSAKSSVESEQRRPHSAFVTKSVDSLINGCVKQRQRSMTNDSQCSSCGQGDCEWLCDEGHVVKDAEALYQSFSDDDFKPPKLKQGICAVPKLDLKEVDSYDRILTLIRTHRDEPVPYLYLPDEILLRIFSFLTCQDLTSCARVCQQFYRICSDESLWNVISITKRNDLCDEWLTSIGEKHPVRLTISHCRSNLVTAKGLREMFRRCSESLQEVNFSGCSGGDLIGESILLHVSARCENVKRVDASWTNVSDNGVKALVDGVHSLEMLCLNGCQALTDLSLRSVAEKHGKSLLIMEVFGCFNLSPSGIQLLGQMCHNLQTLNIGQCHRITDAAISQLVSSMNQLQNLDLRGCKQAKDSCVRDITKNCPHLRTLILANCPLITNAALAEIASRLPKISWLDMCGCVRINDPGVKQLAKSCNNLKALDLSSTRITHKSVTALANYCSQTLHSLKLSFCAEITEPSINQLVKHCRKLDTLHLYGCKRIRNIDSLSKINPSLNVEL